MKSELPVVGWREKVDLPDWGVVGLTAKLDTGARTSAIHVDEIVKLDEKNISFWVVLSRKVVEKRVHIEAQISRESNVRSSTGHLQTRYIVRTRLLLAGVDKEVELSLVQRPHMLCRMLIGRSALAGNFVVDPSIKHVTQEPLP